MLYIDKKYVNLVSGSLQKFKWKKDSLATCRCFKCGDSKKNKSFVNVFLEIIFQ